MTNTSISLQDLRRRLYVKAKSEPTSRLWGLFVHVCKHETLHEAYRLAKANNGAPGSDGVSFAAIESEGRKQFIHAVHLELMEDVYRPQRLRKVEIPKSGGGTRGLSIPTIRDRVVQGALKLILEPIFDADFQPGSFGYRPKKSAQDAVQRVSEAILTNKTYVIDIDLKAYFDTVRHHIVLQKVAARVNDDKVMRLLSMILKTSGKRGVAQGGVISPLLSNLYLNDVDRMLERAKKVTQKNQWIMLEYARFADDIVVLISDHPAQRWLHGAVEKRLREEFAKLEVTMNEDKTRRVNLGNNESFGFLGFEFRRVRSHNGRWMPLRRPQLKKRTALLSKLKPIFHSLRSQPLPRAIATINPILRGWVGYFSMGHASKCFSYIRFWVEKKIRRLLARCRKRGGFGWKRWSSDWLYNTMGLFNDYRVRTIMKVAPVR